MAAITKAQIKSIHVALARQGIDDDTYRAKLRLLFNVSSCTQLNRRQASILLTSLGRPLAPVPSTPKRKQNKRRAAPAPVPDNVSSCTQLNRRQASILLKTLGRPLAPVPSTPKRKQNKRRAAPAPVPDNVIRLATPDQLRLINDLVGEITWHTDGGYLSWLNKSFGLCRPRTATDASKIIEGLKGIKSHAP